MLATEQQQSLALVLGSGIAQDRASLVARMQQIDPELAVHAGLVASAAARVGRSFGFEEDALRDLTDAAWLHDLGKLTIAREILDKPGALDPDEWIEMQTHSARGADYLASLNGFSKAASLVRHHHERYDGFGYPCGLADAAIPLGARIICALDAFDAMTTRRPYRPAMTFEDAIAEMERCAGSQFDPAVIERFLVIANDLRKETAA